MSDVQVEFSFRHDVSHYQPGESLECEFKLRGGDLESIQSIETTVLWRTEGKGNQDMGVHFFQRRTKKEVAGLTSDNIHRFSTLLPKSPLSYRGQTLEIEWLVRVKLFFKKGRQSVFDQPFRLGSVQPPEQILASNEADEVAGNNDDDEEARSTSAASGQDDQSSNGEPA